MNWSQVRTVLWLRWRLTWNQFTRGSPLNAAIMVFVVALGLGLVVAGGIGGLVGGGLGLAKASPLVLLAVWDVIIVVFLFVWLIGLLTELQRSETIDLNRLLHLPVSLKHIFLVNYLASHLSLSLALFLPGILGLCTGLMWSKGVVMALLFPLALSFVFMVTALTYCLRGWLISLMVNQRRRRAVIAGVTVVAVLLGQLPNLYFNVIGRRHFSPPRRNEPGRAAEASPRQQNRAQKPALPPGFLSAHKFIPPLWVGNGAMALAEGNAWPALGGSLGAFAIGAMGLISAYRSTVRFYRGEQVRAATKSAPKPRAPGAGKTAQRQFLERKLPGIPEEAAVMASPFFRSLTRAPEMKMMMAVNIIMPLLLGVMYFSRRLGPPGEAAKPFLEAAKPFVAAGAVAFAFMSTVQLLFNQFGFDRDGFRALVLLPAQRRYVLLAKNLSLLPIGGGMGLLFLVLVTAVLRLPPWVVLAAICQLASGFLLLSMIGNFVSVTAPYRIAPGSLKPTKAPPKVMALIFVTHLLFPVAMVPLFVPPALGLLFEHLHWFSSGPVNFLLSLAWLAVVAVLYRASLECLGNFLQRREMNIVQAVTQEVE
ncbi:MAG: hypothetical protein M1608_06385 [Candidatus Omnitrophica bacterium]|nr:hypothetical protein [Candidatus Omnitrophota bacterium]